MKNRLGRRHTPEDRATRTDRDHNILAERERLRHADGDAVQRDLALVARQPVEVGTVKRGEALELIEGVGGVENLRIQRHSVPAGVAARAAAGGLLRALGVWRAVGAQKEAGVTRRCSGDQRLAMLLTFQHGEAVVVRIETAIEDGIAIVEEVLWRDGGGDGACAGDVSITDILNSLLRSDVLEDDAQTRMTLAEGLEDLLDEHSLAVEDINMLVSDLAVDKEWHPTFFHSLENWGPVKDVSDACGAVGRRASRVELEADNVTILRKEHLLGQSEVSEVDGHERLEGAVWWERGDDAALVLECELHVGDGWLEVGHDNGPLELGRGVAEEVRKDVAIAHVQMAVIRARDAESLARHRKGNVRARPEPPPRARGSQAVGGERNSRNRPKRGKGSKIASRGAPVRAGLMQDAAHGHWWWWSTPETLHGFLARGKSTA
eukprot:m.12443 g.12443  ORF g.12443 m.12443 type:complete len:435 (-) comp2730_c0_seq1:7-1311(-)